jgi:hypothetical protein
MMENKNDFVKQYIEVEDIEKIKAEFFDKEYIIEPTEYNYRYNYKGRRYYIQFNESGHLIAPSFTAISNYCLPENYYLTEWRILHGKDKSKWLSKNSANYGTFFHAICGKILRREKIQLDDTLFDYMHEFYLSENMDFEQGIKWYIEEGRNLKKDIYGFLRFCQDYKVKPLAIEFPVMHPEGLYAGTIDLICKMTIPLTKKQEKEGMDPQEIIALGDIKSGQKGFYESNEIQLIAYKELWNLLYPGLQVESIFNIGCYDFRLPLSDRVTPYKYKEQSGTKFGYKWPWFLNLFHHDESNIPERIQTRFKECEISLDTDLDIFEDVDIIEKIKRGEESCQDE